MEHFLNLITFFRKSPRLDFLVFFLCVLYVTLPPMSPFKKYDIIKNGVVVQGEIVKTFTSPLMKTVFIYRFKTETGSYIQSSQHTLIPELYKIDHHSSPNKIEVMYVPSRPQIHWLNFDHGYNAETFWRDYIIENGIASLILYLIVMIIIHINRHLKKRKHKKAKGYQPLPDLAPPLATI